MTFTSWLRDLANATKRTQRSSRRAASRSRRPSLRLALETLEDRNLLAGVDFSAVQTFPSGGSTPRSVAVGDFNGDGWADIAVANAQPSSPVGTVGVMLGNGTGGFGPAVTFASGSYQPGSVVVGDFNNDDNADLAVSNEGLGFGGVVGVLLGNGGGGFAPVVLVALDGDVKVADFNNDGNDDLVGVHLTSHTVRVRLGNGLGGFGSTASFASGGLFPNSVTVADLNNDGNADVAVTNFSSSTVGILLGNGTGGFTTTSYPSGGTTPWSVAAGDLNNDGKADLAVANGNSTANTVGVLLGNGLGGFAPVVAFASGNNSPTSIAVGDFNQDGNLDLAMANNATLLHTVGVMLGNGTGGFAPAVTFASSGLNTASVTAADFNNDGKGDLAVVNGGSNTVGVLLNTTVTNEPPVAEPDYYSLAEDTTLIVAAPGVLANDFDPSFNPITAVDVSGPSNGTLTLNADGSFSYAPAANFFGTDSFTYMASDGLSLSTAVTVSLTVVNVNDAPIVSDLTVVGAEDTLILGQVSGTDVLDGDTLSFVPVTMPQHGTVVLGAGGSFQYMPDADFNGTDTFTFIASDGELTSAPATVTITVTPVNDPPVNTVSVSGDLVAAEDVARVISGLAVADDDAAGVLTVSFAVEHGTLWVNWGVAFANGTAFSGNGTSTVTLTGTQAQINATLGAADGLTYRGGLDYSGLDALTMTTTDAGGLTDTDVVAIEVLSAQQQAELLMAIMSDLGDDGVLTGGQENALVKKLSFLSGPNGAQAVQAFINQVNGMVNAGMLTQLQADDLIASAQSILASMQ